MKQKQSIAHEQFPDPHHDTYGRTTFGFWVYLLTDFVLFGTFFATYAVLGTSTYGGPSGREIFYLPCALMQSILLLCCSLTAGLAGAYTHRKDKKRTIAFFSLTFLLGLFFFGLQLGDMSRLYHLGHSWANSAFLSAYYTLVGTFSLHLVFALAWVIVLLIPVWREESISHVSMRRLTCLKMFWQFLNIVWVLIFTFVYLLGVK